MSKLPAHMSTTTAPQHAEVHRKDPRQVHFWTEKDMPPQDGKVFIISGASSGMGYACAGTTVVGFQQQDRPILQRHKPSSCTKERDSCWIGLAFHIGSAGCASSNSPLFNNVCTPTKSDADYTGTTRVPGATVVRPDHIKQSVLSCFLTAENIAKKGGRVIIASRSLERSEKAADMIKVLLADTL